MQRLTGLDLARALAIFGMVAVNVPLVFSAQDTGLAGEVAQLVAGRAAALFVVLAGVGQSLMTRRARTDPERARRDRRVILRRALFLGVWGLAWYPLWPADILHYYGVWMAAAALLFTVSTRRLLALAGAVTLAFPALLLAGVDYESGWDWSTLTYTGFWTVDGFLRNLLFNGLHPVLPWFAFFLAGMGLGRQELASPHARRRLARWAVPGWLGAEAVGWLAPSGLVALGLDPELAAALGGRGPIPPMPQYVVGAGALAVLVVLACLSVAERRARLVVPLVHTGQLALTHYASHVVLLVAPLVVLCAPGELGLDVAPVLPARGAVLGTAMGLWGGLTIWFSHAWRRRRSRGPLEQAMRTLTTPRPPAAGGRGDAGARARPSRWGGSRPETSNEGARSGCPARTDGPRSDPNQ